MSAGRFLAGFIVGGALGAIAGVLLAPQSGDETRGLLTDMSKDVAEKTDKTVKEIQDKADTVVSDLQQKGEEIIEKIQSIINKQKNEPQES
ncbi:MAG: YtxH domain-containing protein [Candidatus Gastranaerophilales bacterium]|nr:YtxH domain-containing protein [Candidatus Gastranaerophilales bacterium]